MATISSLSQVGFLVLLCFSSCSAQTVLTDSAHAKNPSPAHFLATSESVSDIVQASGANGKVPSLAGSSDSKWSCSKSGHCGGCGGDWGYCGPNWCGNGGGSCGGACAGSCCSPPPPPPPCCSPPPPPPPSCCSPPPPPPPTCCSPPPPSCCSPPPPPPPSCCSPPPPPPPSCCQPIATPVSNCYPPPPPPMNCCPEIPPPPSNCYPVPYQPPSGCCNGSCPPVAAVQSQAQTQSSEPKSDAKKHDQESVQNDQNAKGVNPSSSLETQQETRMQDSEIDSHESTN